MNEVKKVIDAIAGFCVLICGAAMVGSFARGHGLLGQTGFTVVDVICLVLSVGWLMHRWDYLTSKDED